MSASRIAHMLRREPLLQFLLIGALLLTAQRFMAPVHASDSPTDPIYITSSAIAVMRDAFQQEYGRSPSAAETQNMIQQQIDSEVLYREALRLGLDREDVIVRREMTRKMRFLIEDVERPNDPSRADLQAWLDAHPGRYGKPDTISFEQVFLSRSKHGERLQFDAGHDLALLRSKRAEIGTLGDPFPAGLVIRDANLQQIEKDFGGEFANAVMKQAVGEWSEPLRSSLGLHLVRVTARYAAHEVSIEDAGKSLVVDVHTARREEATRRALEQLRKRYVVNVASGPSS